ncbi:hypothetical protein AALO_G00269540 [Alosa alosa]|uniref:Uncharacterized protein n=1 Tax=Alosa alosa TaxID=278164 RepID=A0AAV6FRT3_9TELE|nr:hypothetical protein AALO_G00269540 [Alosa alosa]
MSSASPVAPSIPIGLSSVSDIGDRASSWSPQLAPSSPAPAGSWERVADSRGGRSSAPSMGSSSVRLARRASLRRRDRRESRAQCSHTSGDVNAVWACCSPRHAAHTWWVSAAEILFPHKHILAGASHFLAGRGGTGVDMLFRYCLRTG